VSTNSSEVRTALRFDVEPLYSQVRYVKQLIGHSHIMSSIISILIIISPSPLRACPIHTGKYRHTVDGGMEVRYNTVIPSISIIMFQKIMYFWDFRSPCGSADTANPRYISKNHVFLGFSKPLRERRHSQPQVFHKAHF
jgi:hypothetical protein